MRAVSYTTEHLFQTIFPHDLYSHWLTSPTKAYTVNINHTHEELLSFLKAESRHTHVVLLFKQCDEYFMRYEAQSLPRKRHQRKAESLPSHFLFGSKLTFTHMRNRTDCGHTYPQEICDLCGNNLYCVSYICLCYLKEKRFSAANSCASNLFFPQGGQRRWGLTLSQSRED